MASARCRTRMWRAFSTRWCGPESSRPTSISARPIPCASSTRRSASNCGRRTDAAMTEGVTLSDSEPAMTGLAVRLRGVTKVYDSGVAALGPLDLDVGRGEFISLLGPSGCGKSTALRLIAGLAAQTSGTVDVVRHRPEAGGAHAIGFVFQEPTLMPWADVAANVRLPLRLANVPAEEADGRVMAALAQVGLAEFAKSYPRELSGGMKMRV